MIAGQPGAGKSLLALWHAIHWANEHGLKGIYFSADSAELGQASRALAMWVQNLPADEAEQMLEDEDEWAMAKMAEIVRRVDADPRLTDFWARRYPFDEGWQH